MELNLFGAQSKIMLLIMLSVVAVKLEQSSIVWVLVLAFYLAGLKERRGASIAHDLRPNTFRP